MSAKVLKEMCWLLEASKRRIGQLEAQHVGTHVKASSIEWHKTRVRWLTAAINATIIAR